MNEWFFYLIRTRHGALYAGITNNVPRRLSEHESNKKGAKYLRSKGPLRLVYQARIGNRGLALKVEHRVKKLRKPKKEKIVEKNPKTEELLKILGFEIREVPG